MDVARDGPRQRRQSLLIVSSACHGVEGFCGSGVQVAAARRTRTGTQARQPRRRRRALRPRAQSLRLLLVAAHDARERRPEPQLPRLQPSRLPVNAGLRRARRADRARRTGRPTRRTSPRIARFVADARRGGLAGGDLGRPVPPSRRPLLRRHTRRPGATDAAPGAARRTARAAARLAWIDLHTGLGPQRPRRAHLRRPRRRRRLCARQGLVGRRRRRSTTARRPRRSSPG